MKWRLSWSSSIQLEWIIFAGTYSKEINIIWSLYWRKFIPLFLCQQSCPHCIVAACTLIICTIVVTLHPFSLYSVPKSVSKYTVNNLYYCSFSPHRPVWNNWSVYLWHGWICFTQSSWWSLIVLIFMVVYDYINQLGSIMSSHMLYRVRSINFVIYVKQKRKRNTVQASAGALCLCWGWDDTGWHL